MKTRTKQISKMSEEPFQDHEWPGLKKYDIVQTRQKYLEQNFN